jgi:hypothetical protein
VFTVEVIRSSTQSGESYVVHNHRTVALPGAVDIERERKSCLSFELVTKARPPRHTVEQERRKELSKSSRDGSDGSDCSDCSDCSEASKILRTWAQQVADIVLPIVFTLTLDQCNLRLNPVPSTTHFVISNAFNSLHSNDDSHV